MPHGLPPERSASPLPACSAAAKAWRPPAQCSTRVPPGLVCYNPGQTPSWNACPVSGVGGAMLLGAMNHPMRDSVEEIAAFREAGFDFLDLTLEPPRARAAALAVARVRRALGAAGRGGVGHPAWSLPLASPFPELREVAVREIQRDLEVFAAVGASRVNVHPDLRAPLHEPDWIVDRNVESLRAIVGRAGELGLTAMLENL